MKARKNLAGKYFNFLRIDRKFTRTDEGPSAIFLFNVLAFSLIFFFIGNSVPLFWAGSEVLGGLLMFESLLFVSVIFLNRNGYFLISKNITTVGLLGGVIVLGGALGADGFAHILLFPIVISQFIIFNKREVLNRNIFIVTSVALFFIMEFYPIRFGDDPHLSHSTARYLEFWIFLVSFFANGLAVYYFLELNYKNRGKIKSYLNSTEELNKKLEANEKMFRFISENSKDIIALIREDCTIHYVSPSIEELLGYESMEVVNNSIEEFINEISTDLKNKFIENGNGEILLNHKNGNQLWFDLVLVNISNDDIKGYQISLRDISDRKQVEEELESNRSMIEIIAETTPNFLYVFHHKEKRINYLNRSVWDYLGYNMKELFQMDEQNFNIIHPEDQNILDKKYKELVKSPSGKVVSTEYRMKNASGEWVWFESRDTVLEKTDLNDEIILSLGEVRDITENKKNEAFLLKKQNELLSFVQAAPAAIAMLDTSMTYIAASERWYEDYSLSQDNIIGKNHYEVFDNISDEWKEIHKESLKGQKHKRDEDKFILENGETMWLKWEVLPWYRNEEEIGGIIMLTEDITQRKKEKEELQAAKQEAEEASEAKAQFLSTMSHEIRTPLNSVIGMTNILLMEDPKEDQIENLKALSFGAESLLTLINDILDFSKIEAGKIRMEYTNFNLREMLKNIVESFKVLAKGKDIEVRMDMSEELMETLNGDPTRLGQIMNNLVGNAIKFTEEGFVEIMAKELDKKEDKVRIQFEVRDTGIGIPKEKQEIIFDSFSQASSETTRKYGGTGLGLAITKRLVDLLGGEISLESTPGLGTIFRVELEYKIAKADLSREREESISDFISTEGKSVLLVEDNKMNQLVAKKFLKKWGFDFEIAENGKEAVDFVQNGDFDVVLMDLHMPEMDGYEATRQIRALNNPKSKIPIIALSASAGPGVKERIHEFQINDFVAKPFNPKDLINALQNSISKNINQD